MLFFRIFSFHPVYFQSERFNAISAQRSRNTFVLIESKNMDLFCRDFGENTENFHKTMNSEIR